MSTTAVSASKAHQLWHVSRSLLHISLRSELEPAESTTSHLDIGIGDPVFELISLLHIITLTAYRMLCHNDESRRSKPRMTAPEGCPCGYYMRAIQDYQATYTLTGILRELSDSKYEVRREKDASIIVYYKRSHC